MMETVIFANGPMRSVGHAKAHVCGAGLIIAVDGGARHCEALNIFPHVLLGDLDSVEPGLARRYEQAGIPLLRHPVDKDKTDLELALDLALKRKTDNVVIFGALGGRWDMSVANLMLPTAPGYRAMRISLVDGTTRVYVVHPGHDLQLSAPSGSVVSLLSLDGTAKGVTLQGFKYPLANHSIARASTLGVSNVLTAARGIVSLRSGTLLCIVDTG